jgi:hypothetical protein
MNVDDARTAMAFLESIDAPAKAQMTAKAAGFFGEIVRNSIGESEMLGVDYVNTFSHEMVGCASNHYMEPNQAMLEGFNRALIASAGLSDTFRAIDIVDCSARAMATMRGIFDDAWTMKSNSGFSRLWQDQDEIGDKALKVAATVLLTVPRFGFQNTYPRFDLDVGDPEELSDLRRTTSAATRVASTDELVVFAGSLASAYSDRNGAALLSVMKEFASRDRQPLV